MGASILAKDTTVGTVTDIDGKYQLVVPEGANTLVISYTGFNAKEIKLTDRSQIVNVKMNEAAQASKVKLLLVFSFYPMGSSMILKLLNH